MAPGVWAVAFAWGGVPTVSSYAIDDVDRLLLFDPCTERDRGARRRYTLVDFGEGLEIPLVWLDESVMREQIAEGLRPLLARAAGRARARDARRSSDGPPSNARSPDART